MTTNDTANEEKVGIMTILCCQLQHELSSTSTRPPVNKYHHGPQPVLCHQWAEFGPFLVFRDKLSHAHDPRYQFAHPHFLSSGWLNRVIIFLTLCAAILTKLITCQSMYNIFWWKTGPPVFTLDTCKILHGFAFYKKVYVQCYLAQYFPEIALLPK